MTYNEIGSEFWCDNDSSIVSEVELLDTEPQSMYLLSGRTAIDYIARDILEERIFHKVLLPSYCCDSMIEPFVRNGIEVSFYTVTSMGASYDKDNDSDVVFVMNYFGYSSQDAADIAKFAKQAGKTVIYDATHALKPEETIASNADYCFCSYRKWLYSNATWVEKRRGEFNLAKPTAIHIRYVSMRTKAAQWKADYIKYGKGNKQRFITVYGNAECVLKNDYINYRGCPVSIDVTSVARMRQENAKVLMDGLTEIRSIRLWHDSVTERDIPMFVPILLNDSMERDSLRRYLINRQIYCPVHWPLTTMHKGANSDLYFRELSLVCDQRYRAEDMVRIVKEIESYFLR